jgi:hypothetical protein
MDPMDQIVVDLLTISEEEAQRWADYLSVEHKIVLEMLRNIESALRIVRKCRGIRPTGTFPGRVLELAPINRMGQNAASTE